MISDVAIARVGRNDFWTRWRTSAFAVLVLTVTLFAVDGGPTSRSVTKDIFALAVIVASIPVYQRVRRLPQRRATWIMLLAAELLTAFAGVLYGALPKGVNPFAPPALNLLLAVVISALAMGFVISQSVASLRFLGMNFLIDAVAGGLAISSLLAWFYMNRVVAPFNGFEDGLTQPTHFAIGVAGVVMVIAITTAVTMYDVTGDTSLMYVTAASVIISIGEVLAHHEERLHSMKWGLLIDLCWLGAYVIVGRAAELDDAGPTRIETRDARDLARSQSRKIAVFGFFVIAVMALSALYKDPPIVGGLALSSLGVLLVRLLMSLKAESVTSHMFEELSVTDPLTGLANRRGFTSTTQLSEVPSGVPQGGALLIDLDNFKDVNDSLGHRAGDQVLVQIAQRLRVALDAEQILARLGGDEFAISCPVGLEGDLERLAQKVESLVREPVSVDGLSLHLSASVGVAVRSTRGEGLDELIRKADVAMYEAKESRSGVRVYDFEHDRNDPGRLVLYGKVSEAVRKGSIEAHLQPLIEVATGEVAGCEALARWSPDGYGPISPERFVRMIELQGLIVPFTAHVLRRSLHHVKNLGALGATHRLSVNVSERDFVNADFPCVVSTALRDFDFPPEQLTIEITEGVLANDDVRIDSCIHDLRSMGIRISIDDFGTGYSTLSKLVDFPVDELKIDKSFVARVLNNRKALAVIRATIELAREMDLVTVAEGVEDQLTYDAVVELGVDLIQGYCVARPMSAPDCELFLADFEPRIVSHRA